ncbi:hypothetical protein CF327_g6322 [Tilletia walkeri]|nr:hypothetical protein CF327_g6322 [Tilletia walkeri]
MMDALIRFQVDNVSKSNGLILADGIWLGLLFSTFLVHLSLPELRRKARMIYWLHLVSIALSTLVCLLGFVMVQWASIGYAKEPGLFAPDNNSDAHPDAAKQRRMAAALTVLALITPLFIDSILVLKVLAFYPKHAVPAWARVRAAGVPVLCVLVRLPLTAVASWLSVVTTLGNLPNESISAKPHQAHYVAAFLYVIFHILGNGWCTYILIRKSYMLKCHQNRSKQQARRFQFLIEATIFSFLPALLVEFGVVIIGIVGIVDSANGRMNTDTLEGILATNSFLNSLKHLLVAGNSVSCICSIIATQYPHVRLEWTRKDEDTPSGNGSGSGSGTNRSLFQARSSQVQRTAHIQLPTYQAMSGEKGDDIEIQSTPRSEMELDSSDAWTPRTKSFSSAHLGLTQSARSDASVATSPLSREAPTTHS